MSEAMDRLTVEDLQRLRRMYENLRGAVGHEQRQDRRSLKRVIAFLESDDAIALAASAVGRRR